MHGERSHPPDQRKCDSRKHDRLLLSRRVVEQTSECHVRCIAYWPGSWDPRRGPPGRSSVGRRCSLDQVVESAVATATDSPEAAEVPPVRLVATDLDGTLLRPDGTLSQRTISAVRAAQNSGILVIPITGRPPRITWDIAKEAGLGPLGVCSNGAAVVDTSSMEVIEVQTMQAEVTGRLVTVVREVFPGVLFAVEEMETFTYETGFMDPSWNWDEGSAQVDDIVKAVSSGCVKLIARRPGWPAGALLAELQDQFLETVHVTSSGLDWVEMAPPGITKAHAVQRVCDRLGVGVAEVLAVGDNYNDLTVLAWAGRAAAPANAIPEVLAIVQQVLPSNREDGVARLLENLAGQVRRAKAARAEPQ
jgi:hydroxymethylpyrimidine pyrophosphatase-like HAD family hydrolase